VAAPSQSFHTRPIVGIFVGTRWINILLRCSSYFRNFLDMVAAGPTSKSITWSAPTARGAMLCPMTFGVRGRVEAHMRFAISGRVNGIEYRGRRAGREVILSSGAVGSPHLLQPFGIGAPDLLRAIGVEVWQALPGVGEGLQDHCAVRAARRKRPMRCVGESSLSSPCRCHASWSAPDRTPSHSVRTPSGQGHDLFALCQFPERQASGGLAQAAWLTQSFDAVPCRSS
jgi:GMC oxidoreductase